MREKTGDLPGKPSHHKANGYYTRDLLTLVRPVEDLKVPRVRKGDFHPRILPYRKRASLELSEAILALYAVGVSTRKISAFMEGVCGFCPSQSISRSLRLLRRKRRPGSNGPWARGTTHCFWMGSSSPFAKGERLRSPCTLPWGSSSMGEGRASGSDSLAQKGGAPRIGKESLFMRNR